MAKRGRPPKKMNDVSIPTPFGVRSLTGSKETRVGNQVDVDGQLCMFPGCTSIVPWNTCGNMNTLSISIVTNSVTDSCYGDQQPSHLRMVSCDTHGHLMKSRGLKKDIELQQFSHMRNVYTTLHRLVQDSCKTLLQEIGEY